MKQSNVLWFFWRVGEGEVESLKSIWIFYMSVKRLDQGSNPEFMRLILLCAGCYNSYFRTKELTVKTVLLIEGNG